MRAENLKSVKNSLSKHWGSVDENYLKNIVDDIQGDDTQSTIADKLRSGFAGSTLTLNVSVANETGRHLIRQPGQL